MLIEWAESAVRDMEGIYQYRAREDGETFASSVIQRITATTERLTMFPLSGRRGSVDGTREVVVNGLPYVIHYTVDGAYTRIVRVRHTSREPLQ